MSEIARVAPNGKRSELFSSPSDDYTNTAATTGVVSVGSAPATGTIEVAGDVDAFRVYLTAGATYTFNLDATSGSLDPVLSLYNSNLTLLTFNDDFGSSNNSQITFTATSSGVYYLAAEGLTGTGAYSLRATTTAADDYANNIATTGVVTIGGAATTGTINYLDDDDLFRVSLTAGVTYTFNLNATSGSYNPYLSLYDSNLTRLAYNDDFGSSLNSQITFTATSSGTYYLQAVSFGTDTGTYSLRGTAQATDTTAPTVTSFSPTDAATGVAVGNNIVLSFSEAIARGTGTITIRSGSATGTIVESFDAATSNRISISGSTLTIDPTNNLAGNTRYFVVFSSGNVRDLAGNTYRGTSTYDFTTGSAPTTTSDDYTNTAATTGRVSVGSAPATGTIEVADDVDAFRVYLTAGATYTFNLDATSGSLDPVLSLYNSNLTLLTFNDDFGSSNNSQITFTATSSGVYYLAAEGLTGTGAYSLRATTTAADDYANNIATTGVVTIGGAATTGTINYLDDDDLFRVSLTAGVTYTFNLNATSGSYNPYLSLYDSNLTRLAYNDDFGSSLNSQITFTATSSGTYYLQAVSFGTDTGTYSLRGTAQATDTTAPTVTSFSPTDAATGVAVGNNIVLSFSEAIARGTGTITIRSGSATGTIVESFDAATSNRISISGSTLTIDPTNNLAGNTRYFVVFSSGNVRDLAGNTYRGTSTYDFTTGSAPTTTSDDYTNTAATTGVVSVGSAPATGTIEVAGDVDAFRVYLTAGATYTFNLDATSGSLDPVLSLYNSNLTLLTFNDDFGSSNNSQITFTATSSGVYYLAAEGLTGTGAYSLRATTTAADDYANNIATTGVVTIGGAATTGTINYLDDDDLFRVSLTAGVTYTFNLNATSGSYNPYLSLYDSNLTRLAYNDDFGSSLNSQITFTATSSGTYYLQAVSFGTDTGTYSLRGTAQATDTTAPTVTSFSPTDAATGVAVGNNIVLSFSEAIARGTGTITIRSGSATGTIVESFDAATSNRISISGSTLTIDPTNNLAGNTRYFVVFSSGNVRDLAGNTYRGTSTYDFTTGSAPTTTSDDYTNTAATTGVVSVGSAPATGTIEVAGDVDAFRVYLTAGATYTFNLDATSGSLDPVLSLYNSNLTLLTFNDDFGSSNNSQITFTATSSGVYYLAAEGLTGTGAYSLRATTTAADDYANNIATTGVVTIGGAATTGTINYLDDDDLFRVSLTAGVTYTFNLNATSGSYNPYLSLYDSNLTRLAYNDDFGSSLNSQITFTATSSGTYYLQAVSFGTDTGTYSLRGTAQATDTTAPTVTSFSPTDAATGVAVGNNIVLSFSEAIARGTGTITIRSGSATGTIVESFDAATSNRISISGSTLTIDPTNNLAGNTRYFVVFSSGNVRDLAGNTYRGTSTYDFTTGSAPTTTSDDYTNTAATTGRVSVGSAPATGTIEVAGDVDAFRVSLTAGVTYTFNLNATSGALDPYLSLYNSSLTLLAYNDDFGSSRNSQITFTATSSGTYYLAAKDFGTGTGTYSLGGTAADDYSAPATGLVTVGGSPTTGRIDYADDIDAFRVVLTAGVTYTFNLNAISGTLDPSLALYDSSLLTMIAFNDDFGSSRNAQITFTATSSGTYYLLAFGTDTGTYSLQGRIGSASAIAQSALSVAPVDSLGRSDGMAPEADLAMIPPSKSNEPGNQIGIIEAEILLALANSNDPFASEHLALQNLSFNQGAHPQSIVLEHSPHTTNYSIADAFHFGTGDVLEHFRNDDVALTRTEFNAVIFDPADHWTANSAFDPAIYDGDEIIFDVTEFGSLSTANGYHQVDFIL